MKSKNTLLKNRTLINGFWIPNQQINMWQDYFSGRVVENTRMNAILNHAIRKHIARGGKVPKAIKLRDYPFSWYIPITIKAEILGTGLGDLETNRYIFIKSKAVS